MEVRGAAVWAAVPPRGDGERAPADCAAAREAVPPSGPGVRPVQAGEGGPCVGAVLLRRLVPVQGGGAAVPRQDAGLPERRGEPEVRAAPGLRPMDRSLLRSRQLVN